MLRSHESTTDSILTLHSYRTNFIWKLKPVSVALFLYGFLWRCDYEFIAEHSFLFHPRLCFYYYFVVCFICVFQLRCCCCCWFCRIFFLFNFFKIFLFICNFQTCYYQTKADSAASILLPWVYHPKTGYATTISISSCWMCTHLNSESNTHTL